jgi:hypothetical protein
MKIRLAAALAAALASLAVGVPAASATFHLIQVREVYPGSTASPNAEFVELQMWAPAQNFVNSYAIRVYGPSGAVTGEGVFSADVANGATQSTVLAETPETQAQFTVTGDTTLVPTGPVLPAGILNPSGGKVCWVNIDCVSWGNFSGSGSQPSPSGTPAAPTGIPDGLALRRTIEPGCPTLLESGDDRDNSALDFALAAPNPRPNSVPPTERPCGGGTRPDDPPKAHGPETTLRKTPPRRTHDRTPTFRFRADERRVTFQCRVDRKAFAACRSPFTTKRLKPGRHRFSVRARDSRGNPDLTPASYSFTVLR